MEYQEVLKICLNYFLFFENLFFPASPTIVSEQIF